MSPADLSVRILGPPKGTDRPARTAIAAALALHIIAAYLLLFGWRGTPAPEPPAPIEVTLVTLPPPPPPAPPQPQAEPKLTARESGPGQQTTAAPRAPEASPETETPPPATQPSEQQKPAEAAPVPDSIEPPPPEKPKVPEQSHVEAKPKLALRAPEVAPPLDRIVGDKDETGDPYLNALWARIERNRPQTTPVGSEGLHLDGISVFAMLLDHAGHMEDLELVTSSGSPLLDDEARQMIVAATPFPPAPSDYPDRIPLKIKIHLFPQ